MTHQSCRQIQQHTPNTGLGLKYLADQLILSEPSRVLRSAGRTKQSKAVLRGNQLFSFAQQDVLFDAIFR